MCVCVCVCVCMCVCAIDVCCCITKEDVSEICAVYYCVKAAADASRALTLSSLSSLHELHLSDAAAGVEGEVALMQTLVLELGL